MSESKQDFVSLRVHPETKQRVEDEMDLLRRARGRKASQDEMVGLAMDAYVARKTGTEGHYSYSPENRELHEKLETVLNSGDQMTIRAVVPNIEIFFERLRPRNAKRANGS